MDTAIEAKNSKVKLLVTVIVFLVLIVFVLVGFICYEKFIAEDNCKVNTTEKSEENENKDNGNSVPTLGSEKLEQIMEDYRLLTIHDVDLYKNDTYNISEMSDYNLIVTAINNLDGKYIAYCVSPEDELAKEVTMQELNKSLNSLILNREITIDKIKSLADESSFTAAQYEFGDWGIVVNDNNTINVVGSCGGEFHADDYVEEKIIDVKQENDMLYVYAKKAFATFTTNDDHDMLINYYKDFKKSNIVQKELDYNEMYDDETLENIKINWDLYDTYKYTFKVIDGKYYFIQHNLEK